MSIFDLLFIGLALITVITLFVTAGLALSGRRQQAIRNLMRLGVGALLYFIVVIGVSFLTPRRTFNLGDTQCFDDWCIAATSAHQDSTSLVVGLRISSRARRVAQRERDLDLYLVDRQKRHYEAAVKAVDVSLSSLLKPGQSIDLTRTFSIPPGTKDVDLAITHGGFPIGWFIIGYDSWFRQPPLVHLHPLQNSL